MEELRLKNYQGLHLLNQGHTLRNVLGKVVTIADIPESLQGEFTLVDDAPYTLNNISDEYHTMGQLYEQRLVLSAVAFNAHSDKAWKSIRHADGEECFGGGWFIVGVTTPEGDYAYHYPLKEWDKFKVPVLEFAPRWDGHTASDVSRILSL